MSAATLVLNKAKITGTDISVELPISVIYAPTGSLTFINASVTDFSLSSVSLIDLAANNVLFDGINEFTNITKSEGSGSVFEVTVNEQDTMAIQGCTFTSCSVKKGNGGALCIHYNKGMLRIGSGESESRKSCTTVFRNCSAGKGDSAPSESSSQFYLTSNDADEGGLGGGVYLEVQAVRTAAEGETGEDALMIGSVYFDKCEADDNGNSIYAHALTEDGTALLTGDTFWKEVTKVSGNKDQQFTILTDQGETVKAKGYKAPFPWWVIVIIVVVVVLVIVAVVIIVCCC